MFKRLLPLLAILTGLVAIGTPAHARYSAVQDVGIQLAAEGSAKCQDRHVRDLAQPLAKRVERKGQQTVCPRPVITIMIPTVQLHADRSLQ